jgi:hypothetical protein
MLIFKPLIRGGHVAKVVVMLLFVAPKATPRQSIIRCDIQNSCKGAHNNSSDQHSAIRYSQCPRPQQHPLSFALNGRERMRHLKCFVRNDTIDQDEEMEANEIPLDLDRGLAKRRVTEDIYVFRRYAQETPYVPPTPVNDNGIPTVRVTQPGEEKRDPWALKKGSHLHSLR